MLEQKKKKKKEKTRPKPGTFDGTMGSGAGAMNLLNCLGGGGGGRTETKEQKKINQKKIKKLYNLVLKITIRKTD
jgi:hypothetical protein